jgi:hypothetical protein
MAETYPVGTVIRVGLGAVLVVGGHLIVPELKALLTSGH